MYRLTELDLRFATVIDSALLHIIADPTRYAAQLAAVVVPGGHVVLLEISDEVTGRFPRISSAEIRATFNGPEWHIDRITPTTYQVVGGVVSAWLGVVTRSARRHQLSNGQRVSVGA